MEAWEIDERSEVERYTRKLGIITLEVRKEPYSGFWEKSLIVSLPLEDEWRMRCGELSLTRENAIEAMDVLEESLKESMGAMEWQRH